MWYAFNCIKCGMYLIVEKYAFVNYTFHIVKCSVYLSDFYINQQLIKLC